MTFQEKKMNSCGIQQNVFANCEEIMRSSVLSSVSDLRDAVVCPKPRRVNVVNHHLARSLRWQVSQQMDLCDSNSRSEIFDLILAKSGGGGGGGEQDQTRTVTSSPPVFFSGSPPSRVSNPLTKDSLFRRDELLMVAHTPSTPRLVTKPQPPSSPRNGCVRVTNFGSNPAVRVVGFSCLDSDRRSVPTLA